MEFISGPVIFGFCSAAATTVIFSQIKILLGLKFRGSAFLTVISGIFTNWQSIRLWDAGLGLAFIVLLLLLKVLACIPYKVKQKKCIIITVNCCQNLTLMKTWFKNTCCLHLPRVEKFLWFISTCRNAIALVFGCLLTFVLDLNNYRPFDLTGKFLSVNASYVFS